MAYINMNFSYEAILTSLQLGNIQNNISAMGAGESDAPPLAGTAFINSVSLVGSYFNVIPNCGTLHPPNGMYMFSVGSSATGASGDIDIYHQGAWYHAGRFGNTLGYQVGAVGLTLVHSQYTRLVNIHTYTVSMYYLKLG